MFHSLQIQIARETVLVCVNQLTLPLLFFMKDNGLVLKMSELETFMAVRQKIHTEVVDKW